MAWTAPRTWVDDEIVTAALLNTQVRDNELFLDTHGHSGSSGDGATTLGDLVKETYSDAAAPAAPGAGKVVIYTTSGRLRYRAGAGGSDTLLDDENHTHASVKVDPESQASSRGHDDTSSGSIQAPLNSIQVDGSDTVIKSLSRAGDTAATSSFVCVGVGFCNNPQTVSRTIELKIFVGSVQKAASSRTVHSENDGTDHADLHWVEHIEDGLDNTSHLVEFKGRNTAGGGNLFDINYSVLFVEEVKGSG